MPTQQMSLLHAVKTQYGGEKKQREREGREYTDLYNIWYEFVEYYIM